MDPPHFLYVPTTIPCANCGLPIDLSGSRSIYCSELCAQVARAVRYVRACTRDGRADDPNVAEAIRTLLAFIPAGGYPARARRLDPAVRQAVIDRDRRQCQDCGAEGTEIDHVAGSSSDLANLRLLCHKCHMAKTQANFVPASRDVLDHVFEPFDARVALEAPRQPSDTADWTYTRWKRNAQVTEASVRKQWISWVDGLTEANGVDASTLVSHPTTAVQGFPAALDAWPWYGDS